MIYIVKYSEIKLLFIVYNKQLLQRIRDTPTRPTMNGGGSGALEAAQRPLPEDATELSCLLQRLRRIVAVALRRIQVVDLTEVQVVMLAVQAAQVLL